MIKQLKKIMWIYIRFVQRILMTILLTLTYFLVIPFSWLYMIIFKHKQNFPSFTIKSSYWTDAPILKSNIEEFIEQS